MCVQCVQFTNDLSAKSCAETCVDCFLVGPQSVERINFACLFMMIVTPFTEQNELAVTVGRSIAVTAVNVTSTTILVVEKIYGVMSIQICPNLFE